MTHSFFHRSKRLPAFVALSLLAACHHNAATRLSEPASSTSEAPATAAPIRPPAPYSHALEPMDGSRLKVTIVEVRYGPGESSKPHSHPCPVIGYIIEGSYRTQVRGEREAVYTAGQSFYEAANGAHIVSANASKEQPVRFLAYFTCDRDTPLMGPVPDSSAATTP